jgi:hypothetical protein
MSDNLTNIRSETQPYGSESSYLLPAPQLSTGEVDYDGVLRRMQDNLRQVQRIDEDLGIMQDRKDVNGIRRRFIGSQGQDEIEIDETGEQVDLLADPNPAATQAMDTDTQLTEEEVGLLPPLQGSSARRQQPVWDYRTPIVRNPAYTLPQKTTDAPTPWSIIPQTPTPTPIGAPVDTPMSQDQKNPIIPIQRNFQRVVSRVPPSNGTCQNVNLFPVFVSGAAFSSLVLGAAMLL